MSMRVRDFIITAAVDTDDCICAGKKYLINNNNYYYHYYIDREE